MLKYIKDQVNGQVNKAKTYVSNRINAATQNRLAVTNNQQEQQVAPQPMISSSTMYKAAALMATIGAGAGAMLLRNARLNAAKPAIQNEPKQEVQPVVIPTVQVVAEPIAALNVNTNAISQSGSFNVRNIKSRLKRG